MPHSDPFDWSASPVAQQIDHLRSLPPAALREAAATYDWSRQAEPVLGWVMAQREIDLGTALTVFFNGEPTRFNYMPKSHVPADYRGVARVLDNICQRVNSGFYLIHPAHVLRCQTKLSNWLGFQEADRAEGRRGRWILSEGILAPMLQDDLRLRRDTTAAKGARPSLLRDFLRPLIRLRVDRDALKFKEPRG
ncbi:hypothetical protein [Roseovarius sp.]|uniref:hypothetical protein n=1 Tax=Roseovarius sp. TaxID=1486281 RepID=UPI003A96C877